jgi:HEAT repeat protein
MVAAHEPSRRLSGDILHDSLRDADPDIRLEAARTLVHSGDAEEVAEVFHVVCEHHLIVRLILAGDLRQHARFLCESAIPEVLRSNRTEQVIAALDTLAAWERAVPLPELAKLVEHEDRRVRLKALRVLPLTPRTPDSGDAVHRALATDDEQICIAAAGAAARMKLESALVPLARCVRRGRADLSRAAAAALAGLPPQGWRALEELSEYDDPVTASASLEALERARKSVGN